MLFSYFFVCCVVVVLLAHGEVVNSSFILYTAAGFFSLLQCVSYPFSFCVLVDDNDDSESSSHFHIAKQSSGIAFNFTGIAAKKIGEREKSFFMKY